MEKRISKKKSKLFTLVLVTLPIFGQYSSMIPGVSLADLFLLFVVANIMLNRAKKFDLVKNKILYILWYYGLIISLISLLIQQSFSIEFVTRFIRFSFYVITIILLSNEDFYKENLIKYYKILSLLISIYIILQFLIYNVSGILLPFKVLPFEWIDGRIYGTQEALAWASRWYLRPSGIFVEPGYAAQYLFPGVLFSLYGWFDLTSKHRKLVLMIILLAIILTTSSQGLFISLFLITLYIMQRLVSSDSLHKVVKNIIIIMLFILIIILFINTIIFERSLTYIIANIRSGGSTALRVFRGFSVYFKLPPIYKAIGVGHGNIGNFVIDNNITTIYDPTPLDDISADYANALSQSLLYYGIIGFILMVLYHINLIYRSSKEIKPLLIAFFLLTIVSSNFFNLTTIFLLVLISASEFLNAKYKQGRYLDLPEP